ncbi:MAG: L-histidine N(alpha)-methyltransferase [Nitriliruptor sp.]|nr:MAG: L-histidine N(alpha)-methyltransferase [Nitriliruptor sp.]
MHNTRQDATSDLTRLTAPRPLREQLAADVRRGLTGPERSLPPIYLYDAAGSDLFEQITDLDEYYPTRTERGILEEHAGDLVRAIRPVELLELGSGSSVKTDLLLTALRDAGGDRYVALDISEAALAPAIDRLRRTHPWLVADGYTADFHHDLPAIERSGRRLVTFLGSTIGNLDPSNREVLLQQIAAVLEPDDGVLLGIDLVKDPGVLVPAYDDAAGVTAAFNRNVLHVINRELDGDIPVDAFAHRAVWNAEAERIEMHLVANRSVDAHLAAIELDLTFGRDDHIVTEHSHKFRIEGFVDELAAVGLSVDQVVTDDRGWFAEVLATPQA